MVQPAPQSNVAKCWKWHSPRRATIPYPELGRSVSPVDLDLRVSKFLKPLSEEFPRNRIDAFAGAPCAHWRPIWFYARAIDFVEIEDTTQETVMARKPKQSVTIELPSAFTDFMRDVKRRIDHGDEAATIIESDDLLQCDCVYGGLYDAAARRFGFRYFHTDEVTWDFDLDAQQIARIANGTLTTMTLWQCSNGECGCLYDAEDSYCMHCDSIRHFDHYESRLAIHHPEESPGVLAAMANLRKIGLAIIEYHKKYGHFPPSRTQDANGRALHSWRSLILPFLDEEPLSELIDFSQPWDSANNRTVWQQRPYVYGALDCPAPLTHCAAIVGADTIWPHTGRRQWNEIRSGLSYTVAAIVANDVAVNWMQPSDPEIDAVLAEYASHASLLAVFVDCHVDVVKSVSLEALRNLIRI